MSENINWSPEQMLEVTIKQPDDFLKVRETLTRIGVASRKDKTLFQFNKKTTIGTIMNKLDKKDKKTISGILYKSKLCNLSEML